MAALSILTSHEVKSLAYLHVKSPATFDNPMQAPNVAAGFYVSDADDGTFSWYSVDAAAPRLVGKVLEVYAGSVWHKLRKYDVEDDPWFFEAHARYMLAEGQARKFSCACSYGQAKKGSRFDLPLGGCTEMRSAHDIVAAARDRPLVLFHPVATVTAATDRDRLNRRCLVGASSTSCIRTAKAITLPSAPSPTGGTFTCTATPCRSWPSKWGAGTSSPSFTWFPIRPAPVSPRAW